MSSLTLQPERVEIESFEFIFSSSGYFQYSELRRNKWINYILRMLHCELKSGFSICLKINIFVLDIGLKFGAYLGGRR